MTQADTDKLIRQLIGGDAAAIPDLVDWARTSDEPIQLVAAALIDPPSPDLLARANRLAATTRDRQLVAIAAAHLGGDSDRVDALAREHLVDYPDSILVAWIAGAAQPIVSQPTLTQPESEPLTQPLHHDKEMS
jgi:hypothetical protein